MTTMETTSNSEKASETSEFSFSNKDTKKIVSFVDDQFTRAKSARTKAERQWYLNLAMYFGRQNVLMQDITGPSRSFRLYTPPAPYYRSRPVINLIRPLMRTEMSKLTAQKPNAFIIPASSDDRDMFAAQAGEQLWDSVFREKKVHEKLRRAAFWACITGNGFIKSWWDDYQVDPMTQMYGDLCFENVTPFHLFVPDLKESDIENQPFVIHASNRNTEQLNLHAGRTLSGGDNKSDLLEESFISVMGVEQSKGSKEENTLVLEMWIKPNQFKLFPNGGMVTTANGQIIEYVEGNPYQHDQFPFAHIGHVPTGKFYRDSTIVDLIPLQREYNRTRGQIIEAKNRMAKPQLAAELGSIDANKITSEPGQIIFYKPGFKAPQPIPLQPLPAYVLQELDRIRADMDEISGQHEVSRGQVPPGVTAATAISYLQEQDETKLAPTFDSIEEAVEKIGYQTLCYIKQYWDTPRKVKVTGEDGSFDVMAFEGSSLRDNTDIRVEAGSALPVSRAAKQAFIMDLMKMGFIEPQQGLEVMEIGGINKLYEKIQVDVRQAQRENLKLAQVTPEVLQQHQQEQMQKFMSDPANQQKYASGEIMQGPDGSLLDMAAVEPLLMQGVPEDQVLQQATIEFPLPVPVNDFDNHRIHIERHNNFRKSQSFENLDDVAKQAFKDHVDQHVRAIMVGAQGAMGIPPEVFDMANNPETVKELDQSGQMAPGSEMMPPGGQEQPPPEQG